MKTKVIENFSTMGKIKVGSTMPKFILRPVRKSYAMYNMRIKVLSELNGVAEYRRVATPLRKPSKVLDAIEMLDKSEGLSQEGAFPRNGDIIFQTNLQKFVESLVVKAMEAYINPTHVTLLENRMGVETWAVYDSKRIRRVVGRSGENLQFNVAPITAIRFTGAALKNAKRIIAKVKHEKAKNDKRS